MNSQDDDDMLRQMRTLYVRSNKLLRTFHYCTIDVKLELFRCICMPFYCCYLWTAYKNSTFDKLRVTFNNAYRRVLNLPWRCSASAMYANNSIQNFETVIRKFTYGFQGVCLTVARSPVASAYRLGLVERPSPLARRASDHDIRFLQ